MGAVRYTDISPAFLSQARIKFQDYSSKMTFTTCNISKDPISQSFVAASYDLVIASHVLHATDILHESLANIRKLLKPGGKLLLFETTNPDALIAFAFGLLKGWWSPLDHEERSLHSPCLSVEQWDVLLRRTQFSGVDIEIPGQEETQTRFSSIMVATAIAPVADIHTNTLYFTRGWNNHRCGLKNAKYDCGRHAGGIQIGHTSTQDSRSNAKRWQNI